STVMNVLLGRQRGPDDLGGNPERVDQHGVGGLERRDHLPRPHVLERDEQRRAVRGQVLADLVGVLLVERTGFRDADLRERGALLVEILDREGRHDAVRVLHDEEQVEDPDRPVVHELFDRRCYPAGELVAGEADDVDIDGSHFHGLSFGWSGRSLTGVWRTRLESAVDHGIATASITSSRTVERESDWSLTGSEVDADA